MDCAATDSSSRRDYCKPCELGQHLEQASPVDRARRYHGSARVRDRDVESSHTVNGCRWCYGFPCLCNKHLEPSHSNDCSRGCHCLSGFCGSYLERSGRDNSEGECHGKSCFRDFNVVASYSGYRSRRCYYFPALGRLYMERRRGDWNGW